MPGAGGDPSGARHDAGSLSVFRFFSFSGLPSGAQCLVDAAEDLGIVFRSRHEIRIDLDDRVL